MAGAVVPRCRRPPRLGIALILLLLLICGPQLAAACCPSSCSGHGLCSMKGNGCVCSCFHGYFGGDCSRRECPTGPAWNDVTVATDRAHQPAVCSNRGACDFSTGKCVCDVGFTGPACNRLSCPNDCSKQGECRSMRLHTARKDRGFPPTLKYDANWDADMVHGCSCNQGYLGGDCSKRQCPAGDDPLTGASTDALFGFQKNEKQTIYCSATSGTLTLAFLGQTTVLINAADKADVVSTKLNALSTIRTGGASVVFGGTRTTVCSADGTFTTVEFTQDFGVLPLLVADGSKLVHAAVGSTPTLIVTRSEACSKENDVCSNRGRCDQSSGVCTCFAGFTTSDGDGKRGDRGDCGAPENTITSCPGEIECSGHGYCTGSPQFRCMCVDGYTSGDCSIRTCPKGIAWFDQPTSTDNSAHAYAECSSIGVCDLSRGECICPTPFTGAACERMRCPPGDENPCSGHGRCLTMAELAMYARTPDDEPLPFVTYGATPNKPSTWDFNKIQGCLCDDGFEGHDCSRRSCPRGDDPRTPGQSREVQTFVCAHSAATRFALSFRGVTSAAIRSDATAADLQAALSAVRTIKDVRVSYSSGSSACTSTGTNRVSVTFVAALGDLPPLRLVSVGASASALLTSFVVSTDGVSGSVRGTNENAECSNNGVCNYGTGECACFAGMASSDGNGNVGLLMDCGHVLPVEDPLAKNVGLSG